jgi:hypothetical protein
MMLSCVLVQAQTTGKPAGTQAEPAANAPTGMTAQTPAPRPDDELAQIRTDLDRMESLNMNMSSEIEFLHDQNLQILLRTNSRMWTMLIQDLRKQIAREEQRGMGAQPHSH